MSLAFVFRSLLAIVLVSLRCRADNKLQWHQIQSFQQSGVLGNTVLLSIAQQVPSEIPDVKKTADEAWLVGFQNENDGESAEGLISSTFEEKDSQLEIPADENFTR
jgi:hypothetical protein